MQDTFPREYDIPYSVPSLVWISKDNGAVTERPGGRASSIAYL